MGQDVNLTWKMVVFPPIFVTDTKIIFRYDFVAPLIGKLLTWTLISTNLISEKQ